MSDVDRVALLATLSRGIRAVSASENSGDGRRVSTGVSAWDEALLDGGVRGGCLVEWLADGMGTGAEGVALYLVREALRAGGLLVVVDAEQAVGFTGLLDSTINSERVLVLRPPQERLALWSVEQALRTRGVAAVWWRVSHLRSEEFRRLQLAAEVGGGIGLLFRDASAIRERTWAEMRVLVRARPSPLKSAFRRVSVEILKARGGRVGMTFELELSDDGSVLHLVPELAHPATGEFSAHAEGASSGVVRSRRSG